MAGWSREEPQDDQELPDVIYPLPRPSVAFSRRRRPHDVVHDVVRGRGPCMDGYESEAQTQSGPSSNTDWPGRRAAEPRPPKNWPGMSEERK